VTNPSAGVYEIAGTEAAIRAVLGTVTVRPPQHSDAEFDLAITVRATETNPTTAGEVSLLHRDTTFTLPVTVAADADRPNVSGSTTGTEDTTIVIGSNVAYGLVDTDGSETVTQVTVSAIPTGWSLAYTATGGGSVSFAGGVYTITGTPTGIRATLDTFSLTPPRDDDGDASLTITVTATDTGGVTATRSVTHVVTVAADADRPDVSVGTGTFSGTEDVPVALTGFSAAISDTDAGAGRPISEVLHVIRITGVPAGSLFQNAGEVSIGTNAGGGVWTFTVAELAVLRFKSPENLSGTFAMNLEAIARETSNGDLSPVASLPFTVTIVDIPDQPNVVTGTTTGLEDTTITFGTGITYSKDDLDGSETISEVVISGVAAGWAITYAATGGGTVDTSTAGVWRIAGTEAGIRATLDTFRIRPPDDTDEDTTVQVSVTARDVSGGTATSAAPRTPSPSRRMPMLRRSASGRARSQRTRIRGSCCRDSPSRSPTRMQARAGPSRRPSRSSASPASRPKPGRSSRMRREPSSGRTRAAASGPSPQPRLPPASTTCRAPTAPALTP
jgi:hypothetical protein